MLSVREAVAKFFEAQAVERGEEPDADKFYPKPNRARIRAYRFGRTGEPKPKRSRIQRGVTRQPAARGVVVTHGMVGAISKYGG
ncbi:hypothetical protein CG716_04980 [Mycolicibacterium sphagni]|uniref:Uncharacterized protein n=1 Tax=Mycolicibacterium sphagni TaxID=1786 RepID=A0A255DXA2_9MYCO|nr:hypothetical protein CG716_04980 [Mycolicibacterium sphagni]